MAFSPEFILSALAPVLLLFSPPDQPGSTALHPAWVSFDTVDAGNWASCDTAHVYTVGFLAIFSAVQRWICSRLFPSPEYCWKTRIDFFISQWCLWTWSPRLRSPSLVYNLHALNMYVTFACHRFILLHYMQWITYAIYNETSGLMLAEYGSRSVRALRRKPSFPLSNYITGKFWCGSITLLLYF